MIGVYVALLQTWEALGRDAFTDEPGKKKKERGFYFQPSRGGSKHAGYFLMF